MSNLLSEYPSLQKIYRTVCTIYDLHTRYFSYRLQYLRSRIKTKNKKTILCYPQKPNAFYMLYKICYYNGYRITNTPQKADCVIFFQDSTYRDPDAVLRSLHKKYTIINYDSRDISKKTIDTVHKKVFGYSLSINPETYKGKYVKKPNKNSLSTHVILGSPEKPQEDYVYQQVVNNELKDDVVDIRLPVFGNTIPIALLKYRPIQSRFGRNNRIVKIMKTEDVISDKEYNNIVRFCREIRLDYGELDVLRDNDTQKIYVVDANNCPFGPSLALSKEEEKQAIQIMSGAFEKAFTRSS